MRAIVLCITLLLAAQLQALAADSAPAWQGVKVLPKWGAVVKVGNETIDVRVTPWVVQDVQDDWLWVGDRHKGWVKRNQVVTLDEAPAYYTQLINRVQHTAWAYHYRSAAWQAKGDLDKALADSAKELWLNPMAEAYNNRGEIWRKKRDFEKAIADYNQAVRLSPKDPYTFNNRGVAWDGKKDYQQALDDYGHASFLDPTFAEPLNNAAWLHATCVDAQFRNGDRAVALATKACELDNWAVADNLDTLAAAYAEAGQFDAAVEYENKAIALNPEEAGMQQRLALFKDHQPFREE